jgi:hypothetical protein
MKIKSLIPVLALIALSFNVSAQATMYATRNGNITFFSDAPMEKIKGINKKASSVLASTGQIEFAVLMKAFEFDKDLLQQHFNENYVESDKYPKATFRGMVTNMKDVDFSKDQVYKVNVTGKLNMHGVEKEVTTIGSITVMQGKVYANADFKILLADYNIEIPSVVSEKISKEIKITVDLTYDNISKPNN